VFVRQGPAAELRDDPTVWDAYFGARRDEE
jgi:hypothetical protein